MKPYIKLATLAFVFFSAVNISYCQTTNMEDSAQENNGTEISQQNNGENIDSTSPGIPGQLSLTGDSASGNSGQSFNAADTSTQNYSGNEYLNEIMNNNNSTSEPVHVRGTRLPNEFPSGRSGGQYSSPKAATTSNKTNTNQQPANTQQNSGNGW